MKNEGSILVVDDSINIIEIVSRNLKIKGYNVYTALSVPDAIEILKINHVDLVITDLKMPNYSGIDLIKFIKENYKKIEVLVITGYPSIKDAIETIKLGAEEYLIKSFTDEELFAAVENLFKKINQQKTINKIVNYVSPSGIIGESEVMKKIYEIIKKASSSLATVLITGETGTGKELIARAIHYSSRQAPSPFIAVNCGAIPEQLLESELFGYAKGAFTGAYETRGGFFQAADGGTIFLDEISTTSKSMQVKLLRVLQEKEIYMVGSNKPQKVNVRVIAAGNTNLQEMVKDGNFREDLYYRLNIIPVNVPPLRVRGEDIILLTKYFFKKYAEEYKKSIPNLTNTVLDRLRNFYWPGNVRELENVIQHIVVMSDNNVVSLNDLPQIMRFNINQKNNIHRTLHEVEIEHINNVLNSVKGNKTKAAEILGIDRKTLREKIKTIPEYTEN